MADFVQVSVMVVPQCSCDPEVAMEEAHVAVTTPPSWPEAKCDFLFPLEAPLRAPGFLSCDSSDMPTQMGTASQARMFILSIESGTLLLMWKWSMRLVSEPPNVLYERGEDVLLWSSEVGSAKVDCKREAAHLELTN